MNLQDCLAKLKSNYIQNGAYNYIDFLSIQEDYDSCECKVSTDSIRLKISAQKRTFREITPTAAVEMGMSAEGRRNPTGKLIFYKVLNRRMNLMRFFIFQIESIISR